MKLNFLCMTLSGNGGTETVLVEVLNRLSKDGHDITLTLPELGENRAWLDKISENVKININEKSNKLIRMIFITQTFIEAANDTVFISLSGKMLKLGAIIRKTLAKNYKLVSWIHYSLTDQKLFDANVYMPYADYHLAISSVIKQQLLDIGISEEKIFLIYNPIQRQEILKQEKHDTLKLLYIGRIMLGGQKNLQELFEGVVKFENFELEIFGTGTEEEQKLCIDYCKKLGISDKIKWRGWSKNPWMDLTDTPNALVLTSSFEGLPMVMLESISRGIPVVSANFQGYDDVLKDGVNGYSYKQGNLDDFCNAIRKTLKNELIQEEIINSVKKFYIDEYFMNLNKCLLKIDK